MGLGDSTDDKAALDALVFLLIAVQLVGLAVIGINVRNLRLWARRLTGARADAVVTNIETSTDVRGATRRPHVRFSTPAGELVDTASELYRERCKLTPGETVAVSYRRLKPSQVTVHGYDFRVREAIGIGVGAVILILASYASFYHLPDL